MAERASKRRRVSPPDKDDTPEITTAQQTVSEESADSGDEQESGNETDGGEDVFGDEEEVGDEEEDVDDQSNEDGEDDEDENDEYAPDVDLADDAVAQPDSKRQPPVAAQPDRKPIRVVSNIGATSFKLRVEEMLQSLRPSYGVKEAPAEEMLRKLKTIIESIPDQDPIPVQQAEKAMLKRKIAIPFSVSRPPVAAQYKFGFAKPASVNVTGSYALKTCTRTNGRLTMDLVVTMPTSMFTEKDYLDHRYFHKRAYYLACIAASLAAAKDLPVDIRFTFQSGNSLLPILILSPKPDTDLAKAECDFHIMLAIQEGFFPAARTAPGMCCVRSSVTGTEVDDKKAAKATPFYNSSLSVDCSITSNLKLLHGAGVKCAGYRDACLLGRVWMTQRGLSGKLGQGGFGHFEWSALIALLLQGGLPKGKPALLSTYDGFQLFRGTLVFLANKDLLKQPVIIGSDAATSYKVTGLPVFFDAARGVNILYKMTSSSAKSLQRHAQTTIKMLSGTSDGQFESTFVTKVSESLMQYDIVGNVTLDDNNATAAKQKHRYDHPSGIQVVHDVLAQGLGNRTTMISLSSDDESSWSVSAAQPRRTSTPVTVGLLLDSNNASRNVEKGPTAEEPEAAAVFRDFWGEKAELRRFKDGSITESVVWKTSDPSTMTKEIVSYILQRHLKSTCTFAETNFNVQNLQDLSSTAAFDQLITAYRTLENNIRALDGLPLSIRQFQAADPLLRNSSITTPFSQEYSRENPASVVIQFEGSGRWPDDLQAIQMTKIAFLLRLGFLLSTAHPNIVTKLGLENTSGSIRNRPFLDVIYPTTAAFRLRIHHEREHTLIERRLADKTSVITSREREEAAAALSLYKRDFIRSPLHTQAIQTLCTRHPALSGALRLTKTWFAAHLLTPHFPPVLIEIIATRPFLHPYPWTVPSTPATAFLRTLLFMSTWDWRTTPLILDFSAGDMRAPDIAAMQTRFEAWRSLDPAMNRVVLFVATNYATEGTTWTEFSPSKVVAARMTGLAKAAMKLVQAQGVQLDAASLFKSPLGDYDFVIHIASKFLRGAAVGKNKKSAGSKYKNLQVAAAGLGADPELTGFDPVRLYVEELRRVFGDSVVWFADEESAGVVAGLWAPHTARRKWKVGLGYSSTPVGKARAREEAEDDGGSGGGSVEVEINKDGMLSEMARLGGDLVAKIERNR